MGYLSVAIFLVLSGYGLAFSYGQRGGGYLSNFLRNRVLSLYVLQGVLIVIYALLKGFLNRDAITIQAVIQSFLFGKTVISNGWYLQAMLLFYLVFYASFKWLNKKTLGVLISSIVYLLLCMLCGLETTWYECTLFFVLGFYVYNYRDRLSNIYQSKKKTFGVVFLSFTCFIICFVLGTRGFIESEVVKLLFKMISALLFAFFVLVLSNLINLQGKVTSWLAKYYLEIYLLQGIVFILCKNRYWHIDNPYIYYLIALVGVFMLARLVHPVVNIILTSVKKQKF